MNQPSLFVEKVLPTILIVDDTPANIAVIAEVLEAHNYRVLVAQDGEEGLQRVDFVQPDLILLDVMMPGMDGFDVCRTLKKQASTRDIPVIFMTARSDTQDKVTGFEAGGVDYVTKPLQADEVLARVETQLRLSMLQKRLEMQNAQLQRYREQLEQRVAERTTELSVSNQNLREETQERKRTQERLTLVDFAINQTREAVYIQNQDQRFVYVNAEACRMLGYSREELLSMSVSDIDPDFSPEAVMKMRQQASISGSSVFERRHQTKEGRILPVELAITAFEYQGNRTVVTMSRDITERKQKEALLQSLTRKLKAISSCNRLLLRAGNEQELLNGICKLVCDEAGYLMAWVGFAEHDENKSVRPVAFSGYEEGYLDGIQITWADTERGQIPIGIAIRTGVAAINHDFQTYPGLVPWREAVKRRGFRSSVAIPLVGNGRVLGSLNIYSAELHAFGNREEVELLQELANDIAYGVLALRTLAGRVRAEAELHAREQEFRAMIENSPDYIARYDTRLRRIYVNPALQAIIGLPGAEILGKTSEFKSPMFDVPAYMQRMQYVLKTGCEEQMEVSWISPQGVERWGDARLLPEVDKDGTVTSLLSVIRDITERKLMENALLERERHYHGIFDNVQDALFLLEVTPDGRFRNLDINPAFEKSTGLSRSELVGKFIEETVPEKTAKIVNAKYRHCVEAGTAVDEDAILDLPTGLRYYSSTIVPVRDGSGRIYRIVGITRDTTELRRYEQAIEESRTQLRGLAAKNEMVREEERKHIAREVHDELGQILTGLQLNISVLEHLAARQSLPLCEHLQETKILMDKSLSVARNVATALRPAVLDMGIVSALDWLTGRYSTNTGIQCEVDIVDSEIKLDENQSIALFRIVQEALTNVSRHAKASRVDISLAQVADDYVLKIRDNGLGFDVSVKKLDSFGVVGMRERALMLDGTVTINSSPGKGTEINIRIPVNKDAEKL